MTVYLFTPPAVQALAIKGQAVRFPINRLFFVGRNYHAHAVEMGKPVDKSVERPFYFTKAPQTLCASGSTVAYPPETAIFIMKWKWWSPSASQVFASVKSKPTH